MRSFLAYFKCRFLNSTALLLTVLLVPDCCFPQPEINRNPFLRAMEEASERFHLRFNKQDATGGAYDQLMGQLESIDGLYIKRRVYSCPPCPTSEVYDSLFQRIAQDSYFWNPRTDSSLGEMSIAFLHARHESYASRQLARQSFRFGIEEVTHAFEYSIGQNTALSFTPSYADYLSRSGRKFDSETFAAAFAEEHLALPMTDRQLSIYPQRLHYLKHRNAGLIPNEGKGTLYSIIYNQLVSTKRIPHDFGAKVFSAAADPGGALSDTAISLALRGIGAPKHASLAVSGPMGATVGVAQIGFEQSNEMTLDIISAYLNHKALFSSGELRYMEGLLGIWEDVDIAQMPSYKLREYARSRVRGPSAWFSAPWRSLYYYSTNEDPLISSNRTSPYELRARIQRVIAGRAF